MAEQPLLFTSPKLEIEAAADRARPATISALAYSGGILTITGIHYVIELSGMTTPSTVPLLCDHENQVNAIAGSVRPSKTDRQLHVQGNLARGTPAADQVIALAAAGVALAVSVGIEPEEKEYLSPGQTVEANGQTFTADDDGIVFVPKSNLKEISIVPIGADRLAVATIAASANRKGQTMENPNQPNHDDAILPAGTEDRLDAAAVLPPDGYVQAAEQRQRLIACWDSSGRLTSEENKQRARELRASATRGELGLEQYRNQMADLSVSEAPKGPAIHSSSQDTNPDILCAAFSRSAGLPNMEKHFNERTLEAADRQYRGGLGLQEMLLRCAAEAGYSGRGVIRSGNLKEVLQAAFSTHAITTLLTDAGNKFLIQGFRSVEAVWRELSVIRPVKDFKQNTRFRMTDDGAYEEVGPGGLIKHGTLGQESYSIQAKTYAKMFAITRTDIVNDDLGVFDTLRKVLGRGGGLKLNDVFWTAFLDNSTFFTAGRANYQDGAGTALSLTSLEAAEVLFGAITDANGNPLGQEAAILLTPKAISGTARTIFKSTEVRDTTASTERPIANIFFEKYKPLASAYLSNSNYTGYSALAWYLLANSSVNPVMEVAFLDGQESPTIESSDADFSQLGVQFRGFHDFDCVKSEWRAGVKSKGGV